jgi:hypothetical protein
VVLSALLFRIKASSIERWSLPCIAAVLTSITARLAWCSVA